MYDVSDLVLKLIISLKYPSPQLNSVAPCRPQAGVVHCGRGHQSAAEPQTRARRVLTEAPAQLLPDKRQLHPPEPAGQRELPPLQCHGHRPLDGRRAGNLL